MNGVVNPIIGTLIELDHKLKKLIENTMPGHECWNRSFTKSSPFPKRKPTPYISASEYVPVMKEIKGGFSSSLVKLLLRKPDGSLMPYQGFYVKQHGSHCCQWHNQRHPIEGVIGWKPFD